MPDDVPYLTRRLQEFRLELIRERNQRPDQDSIEALEDAIGYCDLIGECLKDVGQQPPTE